MVMALGLSVKWPGGSQPEMAQSWKGSNTPPPRRCSRLKSSMPFKRNLALQNIVPLSKQPFIMQPQIEIEDVT
jgi:hypothetical protein